MTEETPEERLERISRDRTPRPLPRRFYHTASTGPDHAVLLDGRGVKTPLKNPLRLPDAASAAAVAAEWQAQAKVINPALMPLTRLANSAIDGVAANRAAVIAEIVAYAGSDLTCYRADAPAALAERQRAAWEPVLHWAQARLGAGFTAHTGLSHVAQPDAALAAVAAHAATLDDFRLAAAHSLATLTGSALLALMLLEGAATGAQGWQAAHVDEDWQIEHWGQDEEAHMARAARRRDYDAALIFARKDA